MKSDESPTAILCPLKIGQWQPMMFDHMYRVGLHGMFKAAFVFSSLILVASITFSPAASSREVPLALDLQNAARSMDNKERPFMIELRKAIESGWYPPDGEHDCVIDLSFSVQPDGTITDITAQRSSGSAERLRAAVDAVNSVDKRFRLPIGANRFDIRATFNYRCATKIAHERMRTAPVHLPVVLEPPRVAPPRDAFPVPSSAPVSGVTENAAQPVSESDVGLAPRPVEAVHGEPSESYQEPSRVASSSVGAMPRPVQPEASGGRSAGKSLHQKAGSIPAPPADYLSKSVLPAARSGRMKKFASAPPDPQQAPKGGITFKNVVLGMSLKNFRRLELRRLTDEGEEPNLSVRASCDKGDSHAPIGKGDNIIVAKLFYNFQSVFGHPDSSEEAVSIATVRALCDFDFVPTASGPRLARIEIAPDSEEFELIYLALVKKLGQPQKNEKNEVQNRMGAQFLDQTVEWKRAGTTLRIRKFFPDLTKSQVEYEFDRLMPAYAKSMGWDRDPAKDL